MPKAYLVVRAEVRDVAARAPFDHWYATDHLPWAMKVFGAARGWRCWSRTDSAVHYAFYEFADAAEAEALIGSEVTGRLSPISTASGATGFRGAAKCWKSCRSSYHRPGMVAGRGNCHRTGEFSSRRRLPER